MIQRQFQGLLVLCNVIFLILSGCGGSADNGVKITGSVTMDGKAQDGVVMGFVPSAPQPGTTSKGATTNAEGKFEVKLPPGKYAVILSKKVDKSGKVPGESENPAEDFTQLDASGMLNQVFPEKYTQPTTTPLNVDIPAEDKELPPFEVTK